MVTETKTSELVHTRSDKTGIDIDKAGLDTVVMGNSGVDKVGLGTDGVGGVGVGVGIESNLEFVNVLTPDCERKIVTPELLSTAGVDNILRS